jgi:S1-C subfamily serine protease
MYRLLMLGYTLGFLQLLFFAGYSQNSAVSNNTFKVRAMECSDGLATKNTSGFLFKQGSIHGVVTSLHGICGCDNITVKNGAYTFKGLEISHVDIKNDLAVLTSRELRNRTTSVDHVASNVDWSRIAGKDVYVIGFHYGAHHSAETRIRVRNEPLRTFDAVIDAPGAVSNGVYRKFQKRNSPNMNSYVVDLDGSLVPGHSGAPVYWGNSIVAIANGGLSEGRVPYTWGIPIDRIQFIRFSTVKNRTEYINLLGNPNDGVLFDSRPFERNPVIAMSVADESFAGVQRIKYQVVFQKELDAQGVNCKIGILGPNGAYVSEILLQSGYEFEDEIIVPEGRTFAKGSYEFVFWTPSNEYVRTFTIF